LSRAPLKKSLTAPKLRHSERAGEKRMRRKRISSIGSSIARINSGQILRRPRFVGQIEIKTVDYKLPSLRKIRFHIFSTASACDCTKARICSPYFSRRSVIVSKT
jgi:hypothetical protein